MEMDFQVHQVQEVQPALQVVLGLLEHLEQQDLAEIKAYQEYPVNKVQLVLRDLVEQMEVRAYLELQDKMVKREPQEKVVPQDRRAQVVIPDRRDQQVRWELQEVLDLQALLVQQDQLVYLAYQDHRELQDCQDLLDLSV